MNPTISVIIPARDAARTLERTLSALEEQSLGAEFEVIVIDDGSRDRSSAIAEQHAPLVRLVSNPVSQGAGAARNRGVIAASAPVLAFTDADCFPTVHWLQQGLAALKHCDLVQGRVDPDPAVPRTPFDRSLSVDRDRGFYQTANLFTRREVFDAVGGFKDWALERPGRWRWAADRQRARAMRRPTGEDTLFAWTARRMGMRTAYAADAVVHHAVIPGGVRYAIADRWAWTYDMPGLARLVPELRDAVFYRRWFFADWTARFDLAVAGVAATGLTRQKLWLLAIMPYLERVKRETEIYRDGRDSRIGGLARAARYALGVPAVDAATLAGLLSGSIAWRSLIL